VIVWRAPTTVRSSSASMASPLALTQALLALSSRPRLHRCIDTAYPHDTFFITHELAICEDSPTRSTLDIGSTLDPLTGPNRAGKVSCQTRSDNLSVLADYSPDAPTTDQIS
jgi:hypothetical protein